MEFSLLRPYALCLSQHYSNASLLTLCQKFSQIGPTPFLSKLPSFAARATQNVHMAIHQQLHTCTLMVSLQYDCKGIPMCFGATIFGHPSADREPGTMLLQHRAVDFHPAGWVTVEVVLKLGSPFESLPSWYTANACLCLSVTVGLLRNVLVGMVTYARLG